MEEIKDWTGRFSFEHKMRIIQMLRSRGVLGRELQPISNNYQTVAYWHWEVLKPELLPDYLQAEFELFSEIRC